VGPRAGTYPVKRTKLASSRPLIIVNVDLLSLVKMILCSQRPAMFVCVYVRVGMA